VHKIEISPAVIDRVRASRGRTHMFDHLDPARTAHIIVDLQNGFMEPGAAVEIRQAREIVPNVNRISAAVCPAVDWYHEFGRAGADRSSGRLWPARRDARLLCAGARSAKNRRNREGGICARGPPPKLRLTKLQW